MRVVDIVGNMEIDVMEQIRNNMKHNFAILDERRGVIIRSFATETAAMAAMKFWGKNTDRFLIIPIDGITVTGMSAS